MSKVMSRFKVLEFLSRGLLQTVEEHAQTYGDNEFFLKVRNDLTKIIDLSANPTEDFLHDIENEYKAGFNAACNIVND